MNRRTLPVEFGRSGIWTNQTLFVSGLKFVRVAGKSFKIRHSVVTRAGSKHIMEDQCTESRVATGTSAANCHPFSIDVAALLEISSRIDTIFDVNHAPLTFQSVAIGAAIAGTSTVIHVDNGNPAACPILNRHSQCGGRGAGRTTMTDHQQRRLFRWRSCEIPVFWWIEKGMTLQIPRSWKLNGLGL